MSPEILVFYVIGICTVVGCSLIGLVMVMFAASRWYDKWLSRPAIKNAEPSRQDTKKESYAPKEETSRQRAQKIIKQWEDEKDEYKRIGILTISEIISEIKLRLNVLHDVQLGLMTTEDLQIAHRTGIGMLSFLQKFLDAVRFALDEAKLRDKRPVAATLFSDPTREPEIRKDILRAIEKEDTEKHDAVLGAVDRRLIRSGLPLVPFEGLHDNPDRRGAMFIAIEKQDAQEHGQRHPATEAPITTDDIHTPGSGTGTEKESEYRHA